MNTNIFHQRSDECLCETLRALKYGKTPPNMVGRGRYNIQTLKEDWNDGWQAVADSLNIDLFPKTKVGSPGMRAEAFFAKPSPPPNPPKPPPPPNEFLGSFKKDVDEFKVEMEQMKKEMELMHLEKNKATKKALKRVGRPR